MTARYSNHREVYEREVGPIPDGWDVHHIDGNTRNNARENLRAMPEAEHHRLHWETRQERTGSCERCGTTWWSKKPRRWCSDRCKAAARRASGVDIVTRRCVVCGEEFQVDRVKPTVTCGRRCGALLRWNGPRATLSRTPGGNDAAA